VGSLPFCIACFIYVSPHRSIQAEGSSSVISLHIHLKENIAASLLVLNLKRLLLHLASLLIQCNK
jgi:hypothetical protein